MLYFMQVLLASPFHHLVDVGRLLSCCGDATGPLIPDHTDRCVHVQVAYIEIGFESDGNHLHMWFGPILEKWDFMCVSIRIKSG